VTNVVILNAEKHRSLRVDATASAEHGDDQRFVQVVVTEFPHLAAHYPILMSKDSETGAFFCGAILGFDAGENLFLKEGGGHDGYRPLNLQRAPFFTAGDEVAIDLDSPRVRDEGQPLFEEDGQPTPYLQSVLSTLGELRRGLEMTKIFIETLVQQKLVEPIDIDLSFDDGEKRNLRGLYTIDQTALRALPDDKVVELFRRGYLQVIYLMIASLKQVPVLARRKNDRLVQSGMALVQGL
jgi:hypothetical protein